MQTTTTHDRPRCNHDTSVTGRQVSSTNVGDRQRSGRTTIIVEHVQNCRMVRHDFSHPYFLTI